MRLPWIVVALAMIGCDEEWDCPPVAHPGGIDVSVRGLSTCTGAAVAFREGAFVETSSLFTEKRDDAGGLVCVISGAGGREGTYAIDATAPGFRTERREGIPVTRYRSGCGGFSSINIDVTLTKN